MERFHRTLKAAIRCHEDDNWKDALPTILLALRNQLKEDIGASPAQLVYGTSLRIPGEFMQETPDTSPHEFIQNLTQMMSNLRPTVTSDHNTGRAVHRDPKLDTAEFVFVRVDAVKTPLQSPYTGPHRVHKRRQKTFLVEVNGKQKEISVDRLEAAVLEDALRTTSTSTVPPQGDSSSSSTAPVTTRTGRVIKPPSRLGGE